MSENQATSIPSGMPPEYTALCPLDGRYAKVGERLAPYFSEYALMKNRVKVEVKWLLYFMNMVYYNTLDIHVVDACKFAMENCEAILAIYKDFSSDSMARVKEIEATTNHDVKAVELFVGEKLRELGLDSLVSYVHIGCTSEDINNIAYASMIKEGTSEVWIPAAEKLISSIEELAKQHADTPMLAHTHGQPATPTTVGKELLVYVHRLRESLENIKSIKVLAKFNGATGNYSAISVAFPEVGWMHHSKRFVEGSMKLGFNPITTQIESHDYICHLADAIRHFNNVLLDFDLDMWMYISMEYFKQIPVRGEVGSSTMPHKVNPIRFENSEANVDISNAILMALSNKLPRSRMQRDLSDSSTMRNLGLAFGYSLQAIEQTIGGLKKVAVNEAKLSAELDGNWEVLAEPIQTMLRKYGKPDAYNQLKELTRGKSITKEAIQEFIGTLDMLSEEDKDALLNLEPATYTGLASEIVEKYL